MSLKRRNILAWLLAALSSAAWILSQSLLQAPIRPDTEETVVSITIEETREPDAIRETAAFMEPEMEQAVQETWETEPFSEERQGFSFLRLLGIFSCICSLALAAGSVFFLYAQSPLPGPDGALLAMGAFPLLYDNPLTVPVIRIFLSFSAVFLLLLSLRELWGWLKGRFSLNWCLCHRIARAGHTPGRYLIMTALWFSLSCFAFVLLLTDSSMAGNVLPAAGTFFSAVSGLCCLGKYGLDLSHFEKQLKHFQEGQPIAVKEDAAFAETENRLLEIQKQHEEAVRTAVTSERFKVELISNVSHDLRTPLTAILGYSELLQKEALSPAGEKQLFYLNQKAGYMRELVEDLFELTKVSSGVIEAKKEELDLVRLLEQTIGLFDDQLTAARLTVRRHYELETAPVITDGGRMHQVIANLLGNAMKYALAGSRIHLELSGTEHHYRIRLVNTASYEMDFEPEEILQRFARGDKARSTRGSGLGLAIAQTYTESVGGQFHISIDGDQFGAIITLPKN